MEITLHSPGKRITRVINLAIILFVIWLSIRYLSHVSRELSASQVWTTLKGISLRKVIGALFLTSVNYLIVIGYDFITASQLRLKIPKTHLSLISLISFIFNNNLGFGALMGGILRFRFLSRFRIPPMVTGNYMILFSWIYWLGLLSLGTIFFLFISPGYVITLPFSAVTIKASLIGTAAALILGLFLFLVTIKKHCHVKNKLLYPIASPKLALAQIVISTFDWLLLACVLYTLLPSGSVFFLRYFPIFLLAQIGAVVSHVPAGIGAFDSVFIFYLKPVLGINSVVTTLLLFRIIYFLIPLGIGILLFAAYEIYFRVESARGRWFLYGQGDNSGETPISGGRRI